MAEAQADPDRVTAVYQLRPDSVTPEELARIIAVEQTVEIPEALIPPHIEKEIVGRVESVAPDPEAPGASLVTISYGAELARDLFDLLAVAIGNAPMYGGVRLVGLEPPRTLLESLPGPNHGVEGVRRMCGVLGRPLLATALKPQGSSVSELASMGEAFARGGGDLVKDDNNVTDDFEGFRDRVTACADAVERGNQATGRRCLYLPHAGARAEELERYVEFVAEAGLPGVLICPMITGLDTMRALAERYPLIFMAHPSLTGVYTHAPQNGVAHGVLFGTLFRLAGADISVFPDARGRFQFTKAQCEAITERLRRPLGALRPAWPAPTGGMGPADVAQVCEIYGPDTVVLIGGALLGHPEGIEAGTREILDRIRGVHPEVSIQPSEPPRPSLPEPRRLAFRPDWNWQGRDSSPYKDARDLTFRGVRRVELVGKFGERSRCDLRYFEVEPGGHTSLERHLHTHVVIGARGEGVLLLGHRRIPLRHLDVACVGPLEAHQLRNETGEPFGFFCVVDHERDRPMRAE